MASSRGSSSESTLRRTEAMVLPHTPKRLPSNWAMDQRKNPRPMDRVLPLRTAPSQMIPSYPA